MRRAWLCASWATAMGTLLGTRRSRGWRMGAAAAAETGARIGGARAAGSGSSNRSDRLSRKSTELSGTELWPLRDVHTSGDGGVELYIAMPASTASDQQTRRLAAGQRYSYASSLRAFAARPAEDWLDC